MTTLALAEGPPAPLKPAAPVIALRGLGKTYPNGTHALYGVSLDIPAEPQFLSLLGPSGCGKSTLLRMIAGLEAPTTGSITWPAQAARTIGFVFQDATLMPWASVLANVALPLRIGGRSRAEIRERATEALRLVHLEAFADSYPRELSGGMRMRVSVARALVTRPSVLLMDEPFSALDEITRLKLNNDLLALCRACRLTVVFVTHSVFESVYLSDRIVVMGAQPGRLIADLPIDVPYARDEAFRTSPDYNEHCRNVSAWLKRAMQ